MSATDINPKLKEMIATPLKAVHFCLAVKQPESVHMKVSSMGSLKFPKPASRFTCWKSCRSCLRGEDFSPTKHFIKQYPIVQRFLRIWAFPLVDPDIFHLNQTLQI